MSKSQWSGTATIALIFLLTLELAAVPTLLPKCRRQTAEISLTTLAKSWVAHLSAGIRGLRMWAVACLLWVFTAVSCIAQKLWNCAGPRQTKLRRNSGELMNQQPSCNWTKLSHSGSFCFRFRFRSVACKIMTNRQLNCALSTCLWPAFWESLHLHISTLFRSQTSTRISSYDILRGHMCFPGASRIIDMLTRHCNMHNPGTIDS